MLGCVCLMSLKQHFICIQVVSFISGGNWSIERKTTDSVASDFQTLSFHIELYQVHVHLATDGNKNSKLKW